ncbi:rhodanese [Brevirhabdus pacifica]|uniref:Rhodanese n=1 Tax=Brevirhabdus pacifica TaxID=1267768 RepID=A0A1U7DIH2_9RHOB|nr:rhodanese-like domain-containing protein [Brevirhabdus pacifica]APX89725.1 rhodanese [Brevirhabdus pacifica]OWU74563.1 rhodanese [Loktanella sp. 22II-4b]PJJ85584.1 rhodanese-related sulfurtransferase [Brevirhabdus pacifica]
MAITPVKKLVEQAKSEIESLTPREAKQLADDGEALLLDIRDVRELDREGRVPGAKHAPRGMLEFWVDPESPYHKEAFATDRKLVLFCASSWRSALAAKTLRDMGVENVAEIEGGFKAWVESDLPVDKD